MTDLQLFHQTLPANPKNPDVPLYNAETAAAVRAFHRTMPDYEPTPLAHLPSLARELGVKDIFVKDEGSASGSKPSRLWAEAGASRRFSLKNSGWTARTSRCSPLPKP